MSSENRSQKITKKEPEKEAQQPTLRTRPPFFMEKGKSRLEHSRKDLWKWVFSFLAPFKGKIIFLTLLMVFGSVSNSILPFISKNIIDEGIIAGNWPYLITWAIIYGILIIFVGISYYYSLVGMGVLSQKVVMEIRMKQFSQLQEMSLTYFDQNPSGDIISILTNDIDQLNQLVGGQFLQIVTSIITIVLTLAFMFVINPILAGFSLIIFPFFLIFMRIFKSYGSKAFKAERKSISGVTSSIQQNIEGGKTVKAFAEEQKAMSEFDDANKTNYEAMIRIRRLMATFIPLIQMVTTVFTVAILMGGGILYVNEVVIRIGTTEIAVTVGTLTAFISMLTQFFRPFMMIMQIQNIIESGMAAADRIITLLEQRVEILEPISPIVINDVRGGITFQNVSFGYRLNGDTSEDKPSSIKLFNETETSQVTSTTWSPEIQAKIQDMVKMLENALKQQGSVGELSGSTGEGGIMRGRGRGRQMSASDIARMLGGIQIPRELFEKFPPAVQQVITEEKRLMQHEMSKGFVLENVNLNIHAGKTYAIVGHTGAGKSTIIKLISRFYDVQDGRILLDGVDIRELQKDDLRKNIGLVPQDIFIFNDTIENNLLYAISNPKDEDKQKMIEISKFLGLHNFVEKLPEKYKTELREGGANISIGQRQLIAFARVLIKDPKVLILDEATSSVDPYTETLIQDALDKAREGRTTIIIAHRLSTIKNADDIVVIGKEEKGIVEQGTHEELMKLDGQYKKLLEMQFREIET